MKKSNGESILQRDPTLKRLRGQVCWGVSWSRMLNLSMSFGAPGFKTFPALSHTRSRRAAIGENASRPLIVVRGRWWLWVYMAYWRILHSDTCLASSSSPLRRKLGAFAHLHGQKLIKIEVVSNTYKTRWEFDFGCVLEVRRMNPRARDELWLLYEPDESVLSLRGDGTLEREPASGVDPRTRMSERVADGRSLLR